MIKDQERGQRLKRLGMILLVAGLIWHGLCLGSLFFGYLNPYFHDASRNLGDRPTIDYGKGLDFFSIYQAGWNFRHGLSVYYGVRQSRFGIENTVVPYFSGFRYLPWYAYVYGTVLSLVSPWLSYFLWILCVEVILGICIILTLRLSGNDPIAPLLAAMWLLYSPYYLELYMGQQSMVTTLLLLITGIGLIQRRYAKADIAYGGSVVWKLNTLVALPLWIRLGRWKALAGAAAFMTLSSIPYFMMVPGAWKEFVGYFHHFLLPDGPNAFGLPALIAVIARRMGFPRETMNLAISITAYIVVFLGGAATFANRKIDPFPLFAMWISSYFLIYKYTWEHHFVMLLPIFVLLYFQIRKGWVLVLFILTALPTPYGLMADPIVRFPQNNWTGFQEIGYHVQKLIAPASIFIWATSRELLKALRERDLWINMIYRKVTRREVLHEA